MKIGFIGLGNMGAPMAANLSAAGHDVVGFDLIAPMPDGVIKAATVLDAVDGCEAVITMLPNGAILLDVVGQIADAMAQGTLFIDCSTVDVDSARAAARLVTSNGHGAIDAPVSGGTVGAAAGTLTFMAGGTADDFARAAPLLSIMGQKAVHCGDAGAGQAAKICNNMILGITMIGTCEAFALADKLGLDRQAMYDVVSTSSGQSWSMTTYCPAPGVGPQSPSDNNYTPGFAAELMLKDLDLSQTAAGAVDAATPMGEMAAKMYRTFVEGGGKGSDFSAMLPHLAKMGAKG